MGRRLYWSIWAGIWIVGGFWILSVTVWRLHRLAVMPGTLGQVQGIMAPELGEELPKGHIPGEQGYYLSAAGEWWWWRSSNDEHEQARRLLKIGQMRLRASRDLMAMGLPAESIATVEKSVGYLQSAYEKGGEVEGQWKEELTWSLEQYKKILANLRLVAPDDLDFRLVKQEELVKLVSDHAAE